MLVLAGCDLDNVPKDRPDPTGGAGGAGGTPTTTTAETVCDGECHVWKSFVFEGLSMYWIGEGTPPECPESAPEMGSLVHADPKPVPYICPTCSCAPSGCAMPDSTDVSAGTCAAGAPASLTWDSPGWEGNCTADGAIPPGAMCSGIPCTQSITFGPPVIEPCAPIAQGSEQPTEPVWGLTAQECILGPLTGDGCGESEACLPVPPSGFSFCMYRWGDDLDPEDCPAQYPAFFRMYFDHEDHRSCAPCTCSDPEGTECTALMSVFSDGGCKNLIGAITLSSAVGDGCMDLVPGTALGSKTGSLTLSKPGTCTPRGGSVGEVVPAMPVTLCCQQLELVP
ncbi:MAG: hypothetical protein R3B70_18765 [Polyangiaceae bacterium]